MIFFVVIKVFIDNKIEPSIIQKSSWHYEQLSTVVTRKRIWRSKVCRKQCVWICGYWWWMDVGGYIATSLLSH